MDAPGAIVDFEGLEPDPARLVFAEPVAISAEQIEAFAAAFPDNARPLQPRNRRFVLATD